MRPLLRIVVGSFDRELVCGRCAGVIGFIRTRPMRRLRVWHVDGYELNPDSGAIAMRIALQDLARVRSEHEAHPDLVSTEEVEAADRRVRYLRAEAGEIVYFLTCPLGHTHVRSLPDLSLALRSAPASRVVLH